LVLDDLGNKMREARYDPGSMRRRRRHSARRATASSPTRTPTSTSAWTGGGLMRKARAGRRAW
jgi:hypothetical protein